MEVAPGPRSILVRAVASWSADAGYAFAAAFFDVAITTATEREDTATDLAHPHPFIADTQTLHAMRFGTVLKIDDNRDFHPVGMGTRWVTPAQFVEDFAPPGYFTSANPVVVYDFTLNLDGAEEDRVITSLMREFPGAGAGMTIYTTPTGGQNQVRAASGQSDDTFRHLGVTVRIIPAPTTAALALLAFAPRRRR